MANANSRSHFQQNHRSMIHLKTNCIDKKKGSYESSVKIDPNKYECRDKPGYWSRETYGYLMPSEIWTLCRNFSEIVYEIFMGTKGKSSEYVLSSKLKQRYKEPKQIYLLHVPIIPLFSSLTLRQNKTRERNRKKRKRLEEDPRHTYTRLVNEKEKRI